MAAPQPLVSRYEAVADPRTAAWICCPVFEHTGTPRAAAGRLGCSAGIARSLSLIILLFISPCTVIVGAFEGEGETTASQRGCTAAH